MNFSTDRQAVYDACLANSATMPLEVCKKDLGKLKAAALPFDEYYSHMKILSTMNDKQKAKWKRDFVDTNGVKTAMKWVDGAIKTKHLGRWIEVQAFTTRVEVKNSEDSDVELASTQGRAVIERMQEDTQTGHHSTKDRYCPPIPVPGR